ncbi:MAG: hypothetical protein GWO24_32995, partial [Akkermansiaceae bacterium]|nr:hypothetical protein [Akkermansiaceae bacterium]
MPTVSFDGNDYLFSGLISPISPSRVSMVLIHRNQPGGDPTARMISSSLAGVEQTWAEPGTSENLLVQKASRRNGPSLDNFTIGKKAEKIKKFFRGEIGEILLFDEELENGAPGRWELAKEFTSRKYGLNGEARGALRLHHTVEPATLFLDGREVTDFTILPDGNLEFTVP